MMNVRIMRTDDIRPIDHNSNDCHYGMTAVPVEWPDNLTRSQVGRNHPSIPGR